ncbi:hypothetical protein PTTG_28827 [Puccinia triticina 1-1 BBBD Race 1]|uniref:CCHC-type domain-containing protein n=1 Tax=Puccinia triticina (isolate 1-1 / race 1 (BBBD)) TaxID=630390 RepID=A0A180G9Q9_PUCT1|nr:hypothetical protein PTTG_28827 [Puccinia triticina 1-1 BBBD Race 1]
MPVQHSPCSGNAAHKPGSLGNDDQSFRNEPILDDQHVDRRQRHPEPPLRNELPPHRDQLHCIPGPGRRHRREEDDWSLLAKQKSINGLVQNAISEFGSPNYLRADGANYVLWLKGLSAIGQNFLDDRDFFCGPCIRPRMVSVGRRIVLGIINSSIKGKLQELETVWEILEAIKARFSGFTKARMMLVYQDLKRIVVDMSTNPARVATEMKALLDKINSMGCAFLYDDLLPLIIHENVSPGKALWFKFDRRIDAEISLNNHQPISFEKTWKTLSAAIHQIKSTESLDARMQRVRFNSASVSQDRATQNTSPEDGASAMTTGVSAMKQQCFRCKSSGHLLNECPFVEQNSGPCQTPTPFPSRPAQASSKPFIPFWLPPALNHSITHRIKNNSIRTSTSFPFLDYSEKRQRSKSLFLVR